MVSPRPVPCSSCPLRSCSKGSKIRSRSARSIPIPSSHTVISHSPPCPLASTPILSFALGELDGVGKKVVEDLLDSHLVGVQEAEIGIDGGVHVEVLLCRQGAHRGEDPADEHGGVERLLFQVHPPRLDLGEVQDVVDHVQQVLPAVADPAQVLALLVREGPARPAPSVRCISRSWLKPRIELRGVRSSWLMLARNWLLARLAASADALAWRSSSSMPLRSVMSSFTAMKWAMVAVIPPDGGDGRQLPVQLAVLLPVAQLPAPFATGHDGAPQLLVDGR